MDFKKTLTVEVNQKGVSSTANALGKLATKAQEVKAPLKQAQGSLEDFSKVKLDGITLEVKGVADQVKNLGLNTKGLGELTSGFKGISGSFTSIATAAERMANSTTGLEAFNTKLQAIRDTLQSMQGLSGTLTSVSKVPSGVTVRGGAGGSTADPDKALATSQRRFINDVTRREMVATKGSSAWLEYRAAELGVTEQTSKMIASLRATEKQMQSVGGMTRETAAAIRMVPAQFTDIVTQLAGGQNPFLIMIQQGGQLRDMFHGFGPMLRAVGPMVLKFLTNPFTIAAAALGTLAAGFYFGSQEAENFGKATILTGNYIGMTKDKFSELTAEAGKLAGGQSAAAEAMTALASTGKITGESIERLTVSTANFARASGMDVEKVAAQYASLKDAPAAAILKLNESYHFLSEATYEQIKALEKEGKTLEATKLAQESLAQAHENMANQLVQNLGWVERVGNSVAEMYRKVKNAVLDVGREVPAAEQMLTLRSQITSMESEGARRRASGGNLLPEEQAKLDNLKKQASALSTLNGMNEASVKNATARQKIEEAGIKAEDYLGKLITKGTPIVQKRTEAYKELERQIAALREANPNSDKLKNLEFAKRAIDEEFKQKGGGIKSSDSRLASLRAELEAQRQETVGLQEQGSEYEKLNDHAKRLLAVKDLLASGKGKNEQITSLKQERDLLEEIVKTENINYGLKKQNDEVKHQKAIAAEAEVTSIALRDQLEYLKESGAVSDTRTKAEKALAQAKKDSMNEELSLAARNEAALNTILQQRIVNEERLNKEQLQTNAARLKADQADLENANTIQNLAESQQKELEWLALSNKEREKAQALWAIELDARKKILAIEKEKEGLKGNTEAIAQRDREIQSIRETAQAQTSMVQAFQKTKESGLSFYGDMIVAAKNWADGLESRQQTMQSAFTTSFSAMEDAFMNFCQGAEVSVKGLFKTILQEMLRVQVKSATSGMASWFSGLFGGGGSSYSELSSTASMMSDFGSAKGNAFTSSGVAAFAKGGAFTNAIVNRPTMFAFANGGVPSLGVMGEKPGSVGEAVMPLTRDSKGDLAVKSSGSGSVIISTEINISGNDTTTSTTTNKEDARALADTFNAMITKWATNEKRAGGLLNRA